MVIGIKGDSVAKWADDFQVKSWRAGKDNLVPITLTDIWIKAVRNFREQKIFTAVTQAAGAITDFTLQRNFIEDMNKILKPSGKDRLDALRNLMLTASGTPSSKKEVSAALWYLAARVMKIIR